MKPSLDCTPQQRNPAKSGLQSFILCCLLFVQQLEDAIVALKVYLRNNVPIQGSLMSHLSN